MLQKNFLPSKAKSHCSLPHAFHILLLILMLDVFFLTQNHFNVPPMTPLFLRRMADSTASSFHCISPLATFCSLSLYLLYLSTVTCQLALTFFYPDSFNNPTFSLIFILLLAVVEFFSLHVILIVSTYFD